MAWLLAAAFLPSVLFVGHWPAFAVAVPGTAFSIGLPAAGHAHAHPGGADAQSQGEHADHCHAEMASCAGQPFTGGATVAALHDIALAAIAGGVLVAVAAGAVAAWRGHPVAPPFEPPRAALA
jgi:hypothetical protein